MVDATDVADRVAVEPLSVDLIDTRAAFLLLRNQWNRVYREDPEAQYFLSWQWLFRLFMRRDEPVCILVCRSAQSSGDSVAFLPLRRQIRLSRSRKRFYNAVCLAGNHWADYTGVICEPAVVHRAMPALGEALAVLGATRITLHSMKISDDRLDGLLQPFRSADYRQVDDVLSDNRGTTNLGVAPGISLPTDYETWLSSGLSSNTRQKIRRFGRRLLEDDVLEIRWSSPRTRDYDLAFFRDHWLRRWVSIKGDRAEILAEKYVQILRPAMAAGEMHVPVLQYQTVPVAMLACYVDPVKRAVLFFVSARDTSFDTLPAGLILHAHMIEWAIARGMVYYDLLRGDEPYKYSLGAQDQTVRSMTLQMREPDAQARMLNPACKFQALATLHRLQGQTGESLVHRLYAQLLESWPVDRSVLSQYADWLDTSGQQAHACDIRDALDVRSDTIR